MFNNSSRYHSRYRPALVAALAATLMVLAACPVTTPMKATEPEPPKPAPLPTLLGTWQTTYSEYDHEHGEGTRTITLTFTKDRYVQHNTVTYDNVTDRWADSGGWSSTDNTVTKIRYEWDDEADALSSTPTTFVKAYLWGDAERNTLLVHIWEDDETSHFERFTRVMAEPRSVTGIWTYTATWEDHPDFGVADQHWTFTFGADGSFKEVYRENDVDNPDAGAIFTLVGTVRRDHDNSYLFVTIASGTWVSLDGEESVELGTRAGVGHTLRYAYAPTESINHLAVSTRVAELEFDNTAMAWVDNPDNPHGDYWMHLERQSMAP